MEDRMTSGPADMPERKAETEMPEDDSSLEKELEVIKRIGRALETLDQAARGRAMALIVSKYGLDPHAEHSTASSKKESPVGSSSRNSERLMEFDEIGALFEAGQPSTGPEKALLAAYWFQVVKGEDGFTSQPLNNALKDLGIGIKNITDALDTLKERKPGLIRQVQKSGPNKQGRKVYKLTDAGVRNALQMFERLKDSA